MAIFGDDHASQDHEHEMKPATNEGRDSLLGEGSTSQMSSPPSRQQYEEDILARLSGIPFGPLLSTDLEMKSISDSLIPEIGSPSPESSWPAISVG
jgi:hypothetical protein